MTNLTRMIRDKVSMHQICALKKWKMPLSGQTMVLLFYKNDHREDDSHFCISKHWKNVGKCRFSTKQKIIWPPSQMTLIKWTKTIPATCFDVSRSQIVHDRLIKGFSLYRFIIRKHNAIAPRTPTLSFI